MKTWNAKKNETNREWFVVDAADQTLGRLATRVATILRGKHKPTFTPHVDAGDFVVVINSDKIKMSGNKLDAKKYYSHSGFFGSLKEISAKDQMAKDSTAVIKTAVEGMLPKNKLTNQLIKKLKVYTGSEHPHAAQKPSALTVN